MKPKTKLDNFLAKIAGDPEADTSMEPKSREEHYLNKIAENSGYTVDEVRTVVIPEQTVTTTGNGPCEAYVHFDIDGFESMPEHMLLTINGKEMYERGYNVSQGVWWYGDYEGGPDAKAAVRFEFHPGDSAAYVVTQYPPTTVTIKAEAVTKTVTPSDDFKEAVAKTSAPFIVTLTPTDTSLQSFILNRTIEEMKDAIQTNTPFVLGINMSGVHLTTSAVSAMCVDNLNAINIDAVINDAAHPGDGYGSSIRVSLYVPSDAGGAAIAYAQSSILYKFMGKTEVLTLDVQDRGDDYYAGYGPLDVLNGIDDDGRCGDTAYKLAVIHIDNGIDIPAVANSGYTKITGTFWEGDTVNKIELAGDGYTPYTVTVTKYNLTPAT